jgi:hypothetical protein
MVSQFQTPPDFEYTMRWRLAGVIQIEAVWIGFDEIVTRASGIREAQQRDPGGRSRWIQLIGGNKNRETLSINQDLSLADVEREYQKAIQDLPIQSVKGYLPVHYLAHRTLA